MFTVSQEDLLAIHRAIGISREKALNECRRRWPTVAENKLQLVLDRLMAQKVEEPPRHDGGYAPHRDGPTAQRSQASRSLGGTW